MIDNFLSSMINPDLLTNKEIYDLFFIIPSSIINHRINELSYKVYKQKSLNALIFDKHFYNTLTCFNQELINGFTSELVLSFAKLILKKIPNFYITNINASV